MKTMIKILIALVLAAVVIYFGIIIYQYIAFERVSQEKTVGYFVEESI